VAGGGVKVALDVSPLRQTRAGTARYLNGLLDAGLPGVEIHPVAFGGPGRVAAAVRDTVWYLGVLPFVAGGADVLHCPTYRAPLRSPTPVVVTVHDLAVFRYPGAFRLWTRSYSRALVPRVVRAARRVIAVSEFTKRELVELLGVDEERVRVVPNAVAAVFSPEGRAAEGDFVLAVGTLEPRKNLPRLAAAAQRLGVELRVVGARGWGRVELPGPVRWLGEVPDEELAALYRGARCLAYPSLYEGFGIPVLEALACGCPVVTSAGGACEEVAGGAAVLVDPLDELSIAAGIERADSTLRDAGLERARQFSWRGAAADTVEVYREAAA
jgi:glycosyltransferase involved in cell wall biosynthesis